ncbi:MSC_0882 family membrane protein [Metamycoplasma spumans]|uniref:MSC_0882 family membrane protein n=1 Tax=Metamycoplasma spumans TaxID=92406 RepID=UPI0034DD0E7D
MFNLFKKKNQTENSELTNVTNSPKLTFDDEVEISPEKRATIRKIFKREYNAKLFSSLVWFTVLIASIIGVLLTYFLITAKSENKKDGIGYYILSGGILILSLIVFIVYAIKLNAIKVVSRSLKDEKNRVDANVGLHLYETYRSLVLNKLRWIWLFVFFITYYGLFNLIVYGLWKAGEIKIEKASGINISINLEKIMESAFKNVTVLLIIGGAIIGAITVLFIFSQIHFLRRINEVKYNLGSNVIEIVNSVKNDRRKENKSWIISYFVIFAIVFLIPLLLIGYLVWKGVIKRKS